MPCPANYHDTTPSPRGRLALRTPWKSARLIEWSQGLNTTSWWFRHHWKTWVKMGIFPNFRGEHTKILETSTWTQQWDPFLKRNCENFQIVLSKNDLNHLHHCLLSSLVKKKPHLLLHQKTKMICDLFLCLQLGLWWNAGIGTWGWRNAKQKTTQRLDAVLAVTNPFLTAETPIDFLLYFLVLGVFFNIIFYPNCHSEEPRVVRKNALCSVHRSNSNERRWFVLSVEPMAQALGRHGPHGPIRRHDSQRIGKHQIHL